MQALCVTSMIEEIEVLCEEELYLRVIFDGTKLRKFVSHGGSFLHEDFI